MKGKEYACIMAHMEKHTCGELKKKYGYHGW